MSTAPLFHGTKATLGIGELVRPGSKNVAYATEALATARVFGPNVYEVEPVDPSDLMHQAMRYTEDEDHLEVLSASGFRVVRLVPADEIPASDHIADVIARYLSGNGYKTVEDWAADSDYYRTEDGWVNEDDEPANIHDALVAALEAEEMCNG